MITLTKEEIKRLMDDADLHVRRAQPWWQNHFLYHWLAFFVALMVLWTCVEIYPLIPEKPQAFPPDYFTRGDMR